MQMEQKLDEAIERVAYLRRHPSDDQDVVPHSFCSMAFSPAKINVVLFDPDMGADTFQQYASKYVARPEPYALMEAEAEEDEKNPTKRYLESRLKGTASIPIVDPVTP